jgi:hypothetical protein
MRTTLTLDPDVAAMLKKAVAGKGDASFKAVVNDALRKGLTAAGHSNKPKRVYKIKPVDFGPLPPWPVLKEELYQEDMERFDEVTRRQSARLRDK